MDFDKMTDSIMTELTVQADDNRVLLMKLILNNLLDIKATLYGLQQDDIAENVSIVIMQLEHVINH